MALQQHQTLHVILRLTLLSVIAASTVMAIIATLMYPPLLTMPNSTSYILKLVIMLLFYGILVLRATSPATDQTILRVGTLFGLAACILEIVHILVENFGHLNARTETISTGIFMAGLFILFALSGYVVTRDKGNIASGMWCGSWSAVVCMLIVITYGLSQLFWSFETMEKHNVGNPDFIRTGWSDLHAFVIADIFEAGFKILFVGLVAGMIFGCCGAVAAKLLFKKIKV